MPSQLVVSEQQIDAERHVVAVRGDVDLFTAPKLKRVLADVIEAGRIRIIVDLTETTFLDSTALGVLVGARKRLYSRGGALAIVNIDAKIARIFRLTALDGLFTIMATREAAIEAVAPADAA